MHTIAVKLLKKLLSMVLFLTALALACGLLFGNIENRLHHRQLKRALSALDPGQTITPEELIPFPWDEVYTFAPYTSIQQKEAALGFRSSRLSETVSEGMTDVVFTHGGRVVLSVTAYPDNAGFALLLYDCPAAESTGVGCRLGHGSGARWLVSEGDGYLLLTCKEGG